MLVRARQVLGARNVVAESGVRENIDQSMSRMFHASHLGRRFCTSVEVRLHPKFGEDQVTRALTT
jgi:hypothetical protein